MLTLIAYYWIWLLVSLIIGLATAWWAWSEREPSAPAYTMWPAQDGARESAGAHEQIIWSDAPDNDAMELTERDRIAPTPAAPTFPVPPAPILDLPPLEPPAPEAPVIVEPVVPERPAPLEPARFIAPGTDDLTIIKGIGPQLNTLLGSLGISSFSQIAAWGPDEVERVDSHLGVFRGRIIRDEWIAQARLLATGDIGAFNERYGEK